MIGVVVSSTPHPFMGIFLAYCKLSIIFGVDSANFWRCQESSSLEVLPHNCTLAKHYFSVQSTTPRFRLLTTWHWSLLAFNVWFCLLIQIHRKSLVKGKLMKGLAFLSRWPSPSWDRVFRVKMESSWSQGGTKSKDRSPSRELIVVKKCVFINFQPPLYYTAQ